MKQHLQQLWHTYKSPITLFLVVVLFYAGLFAVGITCPIKFLSGVSCPGCGMSRACFSVLRLDFEAAFYYNPLWCILPIVAPILAWSHWKKKTRVLEITVSVSAALLFIVWLYRIIFLDTTVVVFDPTNGAIVRGIQMLLELFQFGS